MLHFKPLSHLTPADLQTPPGHSLIKGKAGKIFTCDSPAQLSESFVLEYAKCINKLSYMGAVIFYLKNYFPVNL